MDTQTPLSPDRHLILIATTTPEKIARYQAAADSMGLPLVFRNLKELAEFHSAAEISQTRLGNADEKLREINPIFEACCEPHSKAQIAVKKLARKYGVDGNKLDRIHFATDDATFAVPNNVWKDAKRREGLRSRLKHAVDHKLLDSAEGGKGKSGPGAETGPILSATGVRNFYNMARKSAVEAGYAKKGKPVPIKNSTTLLMRTLSAPNKEAKDIEGKISLQLLTVGENLRTPFKTTEIEFDKPKEWFVTSSHFLAHPDDPSHHINGNLEYNSEGRYEIVEQLAKHLHLSPSHAVAATTHAMPTPDAKTPLWHSGEKLPVDILQHEGIAVLDFPKKDTASPARKGATAYELLNPIEDKIAHSHALLFTPLDPDTDAKDLIKPALYLQSAIVAKQTDPRDMNKPIIVMNLKGPGRKKGKWEEVIESMVDLTRKGMMKDFDATLYGAKPIGNPKVQHTITSYLHILSGDNAAELNAAALKVLEEERRHFSKTLPTPPLKIGVKKEEVQKHTPPPPGIYKVAVWTSATSDNLRLITDLHQLGKKLAEDSFGLIWGAGDRHAMGSLYKGYLGGREGNPNTWIAGFSTEPLLISETEKGKMPEHLDYEEQNTNIYQRIAHMIHKNKRIEADAFVVAPGGVGTSQELLSALYIKQKRPDLMKGKTIIIFSPDLIADGKANGEKKLFWERSAHSFLGNVWDELKQDGHSKTMPDLYLVTDEKRLEELLGELRDKKLSRDAHGAGGFIGKHAAAPHQMG